MKPILALAVTGALAVTAGCVHGDASSVAQDRGAAAALRRADRESSAKADATRTTASATGRREKAPRSTADDADAARNGEALPRARTQIPAPPHVAAPPPDATRTASGLAYKVLEPGTGTAHPTARDIVEVNYTGWTTDGKMFDSSVARGRPAHFKLAYLIPGWVEGLQLMTVGEKARFWIPEKLAYKGHADRPKGMLVFDVELVGITRTPKVPKDVAAPPQNANKTQKGVYYVVLKKGTGTEHPTAASSVKVNYTGWTTDGKMFDSSVVRGRPATFSLRYVVSGFADGLETMTVGERARFWIPQKLAYKGRPGAPQGMLVFDVELLSIENRSPAAPVTATPPQ